MALAALVVVAVAACSGERHHDVATSTIVSQGSVVEAMILDHRAIYPRATDALAAHVHGAEYAREVAPINQVFEARSRALQALSADLYGSAALVDALHAADAGAGAYTDAARSLLEAIERDVAVLRDGSVLPAVTVPQSIDDLATALRAASRQR